MRALDHCPRGRRISRSGSGISISIASLGRRGLLPGGATEALAEGDGFFVTKGSIASALLELDAATPAGSLVVVVAVAGCDAAVVGRDVVVGALAGSEGDADLKPPRD